MSSYYWSFFIFVFTVSTVKLNMKSLLLVQHLISKNRKNQQRLQLYFNILLAINSLSFKKIKRYKKQLQKRQRRQVLVSQKCWGKRWIVVKNSVKIMEIHPISKTQKLKSYFLAYFP